MPNVYKAVVQNLDVAIVADVATAGVLQSAVPALVWSISYPLGMYASAATHIVKHDTESGTVATLKVNLWLRSLHLMWPQTARTLCIDLTLAVHLYVSSFSATHCMLNFAHDRHPLSVAFSM